MKFYNKTLFASIVIALLFSILFHPSLASADADHIFRISVTACVRNGDTEVDYTVTSWDTTVKGLNPNIRIDYQTVSDNFVETKFSQNGYFTTTAYSFAKAFTIKQEVDKIVVIGEAIADWGDGKTYTHPGGQVVHEGVDVLPCQDTNVCGSEPCTPTGIPGEDEPLSKRLFLPVVIR